MSLTLELNLGPTSLRITGMVFLKEEGFGRAGVVVYLVVYLLTSRLITLQRLVNLKYVVTNNGYKDIKVVTGGRANFNRDFNKNT